MSEATPQRPRPIATDFTEPFWEGTRAGELRVQRCNDCQRFRWTPNYACPACWSEAFDWVAVSGRGTLYSYTVIHRPVDPSRFPAPYVLAVVALEEGVHMLTNLVDVDHDRLRVGMSVEVRFEKIDDEFSVYPFAPAAAADRTTRPEGA